MSFQSHPSTSLDFQLVFESLPGYALFVSPEEPFTILASTRALRDDFGRTSDDVLGIGLFEAFPGIPGPKAEEMRAPVKEKLRAAAQTGRDQKLESNRFDVQLPSGEFRECFWNIVITPVSDEAGHVRGITISASDITRIVREARKIRKTLVESILGASFDGIYALEAIRNANGDIIDFTYRFANKVTANFLGLTPEAIVGKRMLNLIPENRKNGFFDIFCRVLSSGESMRDQTHFVSSQMKHWFNYVIVPISDDTLVVTIQDISEQKRDEEALKNQKLRLEDSLEDLKIANDNLERFAFAASHDLQEPLRKVQMFSNLLLDHSGDALDDKAQTYIRKIVTSTSRMSQLVNDILQFSQQSEAVRYDHRVDMNALLANVESDLEIAIQQQRAKITRDELPVVSGNPSQLNQLFYNLYSNALKFSRRDEKETQITVTTRPVSGDDLRNKSRRYVAITIADNGIGFDEQYGEKIFELFSRLHSTADYAGSGIGLALCKKIAQNHGGDIVAISPGGQGASFEVILPLA